MKRILACCLFLFASLSFAQHGSLPNTKLTPGAINPTITQGNMDSTICNKHWSTKSIRPAANYTNKLKKQQIVQYGYFDKNPAHYEEDHLISLEIGGNPTDPQNLWPQPRKGAWNSAMKDALENRLHKLTCARTITLQEAQREISTDWTSAYQKYMQVK